MERAQAEMNTLAHRAELESPQTNLNWGVTIVPIRNQIVGYFRPALLVLLGAVVFVLLIACANIANLLMARASAREREIAIRMALGASRGRLIRQLLSESILLAIIGGAFGLILAIAGGNLLMKLSPTRIPLANDLGVNASVLLFTFAIACLTGLLFGLFPAIRILKPDLNSTLKDGGRSNASSSGRRIRNILVISEIAITMVLLIGAGLLLKSFFRLQQIDPGFKTDNTLSFSLQLPSSKYRDWSQVTGFYSQALDRITAVNGVRSVGATGFMPLESGWRVAFIIKGEPAVRSGERAGGSMEIGKLELLSDIGHSFDCWSRIQ